VKTPVVRIIIALSGIGLLSQAVAQAQYGLTTQMDPQASSPAVQEAAPAPMPPKKAAASPAAQGTNGGPTKTPTVTADGSAEEPLLIDNGLWEGASLGPCCPKCGGSGPPADWYTRQGVRILGRGSPRNLPILYQTPPGGNYTAVQVDAVPDYQVLNFPGTTLAARVAMNTKQLGLGVAPGYEATLGHYFCRDRNNNDHFVELTFWGFNTWSGSRTVNGYLVPIYNPDVNPPYTQQEANLINSGLMTPVTTGDVVGSLRTPYPTPYELPGATETQKTLSLAFNYGTLDAVTYQSSMNNIELDGRINPRGEPDRLVLHPDGRWERECHEGRYISYLYGLRVMQIDERFTFYSRSHGFRDVNPSQVTQIYDATGTYDISTHNTLLGLQIGADLTFRRCKWAWGIEAKMGPYINFANQGSDIVATVDGQPQFDVAESLSGTRCSAALIGEFGFQASYKFRPNLVGRASWDFMWITGVALAPEQLQFVATPVNRVNTNGYIYSQGVSLGVEWMW
jgi:hypothetical protein